VSLAGGFGCHVARGKGGCFWLMLFPNHFSTERLYGWKWLEMVEFILIGTIIDTLLSIKEGNKKWYIQK
jgi:hypothetical protein